MNKNGTITFGIFILCIAFITFASCKREWDNPNDPLNYTEPDSVKQWLISDLHLNKIDKDKIKLSWSSYPTVEGLPLSGYKIDKKINDEAWIIAYEILSGDSNTFIDPGIDTRKYDYYYRIYAFADSLDYLSNWISHTFRCGDTFYDMRDGNKYKTIKIGRQCWFRENLRYLPKVYYSYSIVSEQPRYFVYDYEGESISEATQSVNYKTFGTLFNRNAAVIACPEYRGWRMPDNEDWYYLKSNAGNEPWGALKDTLTMLWNPPNTGATDSIGFMALPGGYLEKITGFKDKNRIAKFWGEYSTLELSHDTAYHPFSSSYSMFDFAFSLRCVKTYYGP